MNEIERLEQRVTTLEEVVEKQKAALDALCLPLNTTLALRQVARGGKEALKEWNKRKKKELGIVNARGR